METYWDGDSIAAEDICMKVFKKEWDFFKEKVIPEKASEDQVIDMEKAFYAGGYIAHSLMIDILKENQKESKKQSLFLGDEIKERIEELILPIKN